MINHSINNPFSQAVDSLFVKLGTIGIYCRKPSNEELIVTVIPKRPDNFYEIEHHQAIHGEMAVFHIRLSELQEPKVGDTIILNTRSYRIAEKPKKDAHRLVWTLAISSLHTRS